MQFLIPWVITFGMFGSLGGDPQEFTQGGTSAQLGFKTRPLIWVPVMTVLAVLRPGLVMNNLPQHRCGSAPIAIGKYLWLELLGFAGAATGIVLLVFVKPPIPELLWIFVVLLGLGRDDARCDAFSHAESHARQSAKPVRYFLEQT